MKAENLLKYLFTFTFASILLVGTAVAAPRARAEQDVVACDYGYSDLEEIAGIMLEKSSNLAANGVHCGKYAIEGAFKIPYKNGVKEGIQKEYHESGALMSETPYKNGVKEGVGKIYNSAGELQQEIPYKNGIRDDAGCDHMYSDLEEIANLAANGVYCTYHSDESSRLSHEVSYKNGVKDGIQKEYDYEGLLKAEVPYKNGAKEGIAKEYYGDGLLASETPYKNGARDGIEKKYYFHSKEEDYSGLKYEIPYKNDVRDGIAKEYHENGLLASETPYKNGARDGIEKEYYKNGVLRCEYAYENDVMGVVKYYDINGRLYDESTPFDRSVDNVIDGIQNVGIVLLVTTCSPAITSFLLTVDIEDFYTKKLSDTEFFVRGNMDSLIRDIANAKGDTIDALAVLIDATDDKAFGERLQANFEIIFPNAAFDYLHVAHTIEMLGRNV